MFAEKCKELREELKAARDVIDSLNHQLADMATRAEVNTARKVNIYKKLQYHFFWDPLSFNLLSRLQITQRCDTTQ